MTTSEEKAVGIGEKVLAVRYLAIEKVNRYQHYDQWGNFPYVNILCYAWRN